MTTGSAGAISTVSGAITNGATLLWFDNFEDAANAALPATWLPDTTGANQNLQANLAANAFHDGASNLALAARLQTSGSFSYTGAQIYGGPSRWCPIPGYMEYRAKMPLLIGFWPTLWTMGANNPGNAYPFNGWPACGETDIVENMPADSLSTVYATMHFAGGATSYGGAALSASQIAYDNNYHEWGVYYTGSVITLYRDQVAYWSFTQTQLTAAQSGNTWEWSSYSQVPLLSIYVGGSGGGTPSGGTSYPVEMLVDYVTCWSKPPFI